LDVEFLEKEFSKPQPAPTKATDKPAKVEVVKVTLIGPERTKNMELVLGKLKMGFNLIAEALITCDPKVLTLTILESLEVIAPTDEEVGLLKGYDGDRTLLA
jgi:hypothetical protein